ncbi:GNAT family N-acetyltransferase [Oculatella sp. LEGE 06141]|nr:GNAT family N-acetyltransferase [Oculatella sp. LEGE 06141]
MRPYGGEADLQPIVNLLNACEAVDRLDSFYSTTALQQGLAEPGFDPIHDMRLWEDENNDLIAIGKLRIPSTSSETIDSHLWFQVHPRARHRNLEAEIIAWSESRLRDVERERQLPVKLRSSTCDHKHNRIAFLNNCGFTYERCFLTMVRSLTAPIPLPQLPTQFTVVDARSGFSIESWVEMFNQTFVDHWGFYRATVDQCKHGMSDPNYHPALDLVAIAPDGTFSAFCFCYINKEKNQAKGQTEGWISSLGTRRGFRRMGLARAMLLSGMHRLQAAGMSVAKLGVDTENPNFAQNLYESVGFTKARAKLTFVKTLS